MSMSVRLLKTRLVHMLHSNFFGIHLKKSNGTMNAYIFCLNFWCADMTKTLTSNQDTSLATRFLTYNTFRRLQIIWA